MSEYSEAFPDTQEPFLLSELDIISPEDEAREFLRRHNTPAPIDIRYGICSDYEIGIYDAKTALIHLVDYGGLGNATELMRVICAGVMALGSEE